MDMDVLSVRGIKKRTVKYVRDEMTKDSYILLSDRYENSIKNLDVKCPKGHVYSVTWGNFQMGQRCPICRESKGEKSVAKYLDRKNIKYMCEKRFKRCRNKKPLPFDFYIPSLDLCIEYNGKQHYEILNNNFFGGKKELEARKMKDRIKQRFCKENGIKLIEIPYWDFNKIEEILKKELID